MTTVLYQMRCVWPAPGGILVERLVEEEPGHAPCEDGLAVFFSLQHPLNDFAPITFRSRSAGELLNAQCFDLTTIFRVAIIIGDSGVLHQHSSACGSSVSRHHASSGYHL